MVKKALHGLTMLFILLCMACGIDPNSVTKQIFVLDVYGIMKAPDGATGNSTPQFYNLALNKVTLTKSDGVEVIFTPTTNTYSRIINRPQTLLSEDISSYQETSFSSLAINFNASVIVGGKYSDNYSLTLSNPTPTLQQTFTVEKGKGLVATLKIHWLNTIIRDEAAETETILQPAWELIVESK